MQQLINVCLTLTTEALELHELTAFVSLLSTLKHYTRGASAFIIDLVQTRDG